jgi:tryptophanase
MTRIIPEPYRIKMVEPIHLIPRSERESILKKAAYNLFQVPAEAVYIDLLTDSGTGAMSSEQWAAMITGDESYAGARSFYLLQEVIEELFGFSHVLPTHQGRGAERVLCASEIKKGHIVPSNAHFDTTRANLEWAGAIATDLPTACANQPFLHCSFKGNMDTDHLKDLLQKHSAEIPFVMLTITNNRTAGQPVSMGNLRKVSQICKEYGKPLFIDACRHAENAYFIKQRDPSYCNAAIPEITREFFSYADGMLMSAKKDGLCNIGGFLAVKDESLYRRLNETLIIMEGFTTYGGLAGRDLGAIAVGLKEAVQEEYLAHRIGQVQFLGEELEARKIPIYKPLGGHAVYVDAEGFFESEKRKLPGQSLVSALYLEGGIRSCDLGSGMFAAEADDSSLHLELLRLAIPRRTYTETHLRYVAEVFSELRRNREHIPNLKFQYRPQFLGHFTARFEPATREEQISVH